MILQNQGSEKHNKTKDAQHSQSPAQKPILMHLGTATSRTLIWDTYWSERKKKRRKESSSPDNISVLHFLEEWNFSDGCAGNAFIFLLQPYLLQRNSLVCHPVPSPVDHSIRSLSYFLHLLILSTQTPWTPAAAKWDEMIEQTRPRRDSEGTKTS